MRHSVLKVVQIRPSCVIRRQGMTTRPVCRRTRIVHCLQRANAFSNAGLYRHEIERSGCTRGSMHCLELNVENCETPRQRHVFDGNPGLCCPLTQVNPRFVRCATVADVPLRLFTSPRLSMSKDTGETLPAILHAFQPLNCDTQTSPLTRKPEQACFLNTKAHKHALRQL